MTNTYSNNNEQNTSEEPRPNTAKWVTLTLIIVMVLSYLGYYFGSTENTHKINRLNRTITQYGEVQSFEEIITKFESLSEQMTLSNSERDKLVQLLDQIIEHKNKVERLERQLNLVETQLSSEKNKNDELIADLQSENTLLKQQIVEYEEVIEYKTGATKSFILDVQNSFSLLKEPSSRIALEKILSNGSAQLYVGNAMMFFHVGHTLRFRFAPGWLCDVTLTKIDVTSQQGRFEYTCYLNE